VEAGWGRVQEVEIISIFVRTLVLTSMETSSLVQVILYFVPAILVLGACYLLIKKFLDNESKARILELKKGIQRDVLPLRLNAYERLVLFLERISPNNLLVRVNRPGISARTLHSELLTTIRTEYEHNLVQQIYVSASAWEAARRGKDDVIKILNLAMARMNEKSQGMDLAKAIFDIVLKMEVSPVQDAINSVKKEVRQLYL
jgi:hypothetical protein